MSNPVVAYKEGATALLSEVREVLAVKNIEAVLAFDKRFVYRKVAICKNCRKDHKKGCCDKYGRLNRTSLDRIENCLLTRKESTEQMTNLGKYLEYKAKLTKPYKCECGSVVQHCKRTTHFKSQKHRNYENC